MFSIKWIGTALIVWTSLATNAQNFNLVPNGDFEEYTQCPDDHSQINRAVGWKTFRGSCDYFNGCDATGYVGVPLNITLGFQPALSGDGYGGVIGLAYNNGREIMGAALSEPLQIGESYYVEFFWSRTFGGGFHANCDCASSHLGALMTTHEYNGYADIDPIPFDNFAQVYDDNLLVDTVVWRKISGWFTADSAYTHIAIGNFFDLSNCQTAYYNGSPDSIFLKTYYYIENVCVATDPAYCDTPTGMAEQAIKNRYALFPNPAPSVLHVRGIKEPTRYHVFDIQGREVNSGMIAPEGEIAINALADGTYVLQLKTNEGVWTERFIKTP